MTDENFIKNIISKDKDLSNQTIESLISTENTEQFRELCENSDFIFPFLKERIIEDFVKLVNKEDLETIFKFSKIYSSDFEDLIVNSWLKFAQEDLTDEILELLESGTQEQKAYAAKYFSKIQDSLAIPYLEKEAFSNFAPLKINCAQTLKAFEDKNTLNKMMEVVLDSNDEFEKEGAFRFINAYGGENSIKFIMRNAPKSPFVTGIISNLLDYNELDTLKEILNASELTKLFNILIEGYPEAISLETIAYYQIYDFIKLIASYKNQYAINTLLIAKSKFEEFQSNDIYIYDLDNNLKNLLEKIARYLGSLDLPVENLEKELKESKNILLRFDCALDVLKETGETKCLELLCNFINNRELEYKYIPKAVSVLKEFDMTSGIKQAAIDEIEDLNIKALVESYLNN